MFTPANATQRSFYSGQPALAEKWLIAYGKDPIAGWGQLQQGKVMSLLRRYPLIPSQQALLATQVGAPPPPLTESESGAGQSGASDAPADLNTEGEDCPNNGIGE